MAFFPRIQGTLGGEAISAAFDRGHYAHNETFPPLLR